MSILGLDFDNTLINYDEVFYEVAKEKGLVDNMGPTTKNGIRNYLRGINKDHEFTLLQGEVYGPQIIRARPSLGMKQCLEKLKSKGIQMHLISHKTIYPYAGPKYDLHKAATEWLEMHKFFDKGELDWKRKQINYMSTKKEKIEKIIELECTHYIDDLPEILESLPKYMTRILYDPKNELHAPNEVIKIKHWDEVEGYIKY